MAINPNTTPLQDELLEYLRAHGPKTSNELATALGVSARAVSNSLSFARGAGLVTDGIVCWSEIRADGSHTHMIHTSRPAGPIIWYLEELNLREMFDTAYEKQLIDEKNRAALVMAASTTAAASAPSKPAAGDDLIEQVARAIYNADDDRAADGDDRWEWWSAEARAAIPVVLEAASRAVGDLLTPKPHRLFLGSYVVGVKAAQDQINELAIAVEGDEPLFESSNGALVSVTSVLQMSHLPEGTAVLSAGDNIWQRLTVDGDLVWLEPGSDTKHPSSDIALPATIIPLAHAFADGVNL